MIFEAQHKFSHYISTLFRLRQKGLWAPILSPLSLQISGIPVEGLQSYLSAIHMPSRLPPIIIPFHKTGLIDFCSSSSSDLTLSRGREGPLHIVLSLFLRHGLTRIPFRFFYIFCILFFIWKRSSISHITIWVLWESSLYAILEWKLYLRCATTFLPLFEKNATLLRKIVTGESSKILHTADDNFSHLSCKAWILSR